MSECIDKICALYHGRRPIPGMDVAIVPGLLQCFGKEPKELQEGLVQDYPIRKQGDEIVPGVVQWVHGSNDALRYRGNELMREKIWLQDGMPDEKGYAYYYYTGVQWEVVPAQTDWAQCPEVASVTNNLKLFNERVGAKPSNQAIITRYKNQDFGIGAHFDKPKSIAPSDKDGTSLITVIKTGDVGRKFNIYDLEENLLWGEVVAPGDAIVMTLEANLKTKHEVPIEKDAAIGDSGSIVFRSISSIVPFAEVMKKREASRKQKRKAREEKELRKEAAVAAAKVSKEGGKYKVSIVPSSVSGDVPDVPVVKVARVQ